jgi:hypothetical protein
MNIGSPAAEPPSTPVANSPSAFGAGASGLALSASFEGSAGAEDFSSMATGAFGVRGGSAEIVLQHKSASAERINDHLSHCRPGEGAGVAATINNLLFRKRGVIGSLVITLVVLHLPSSHSAVLALSYQCRSTTHGCARTAIIPRESESLVTQRPNARF